MECYYNNPEATAEVLKDGWLLTGDMGRQDEDGFIYLVDRKKDVIISGGENLYPVEIEDFIMKNDKIKDVAVIGLPDKRQGEIAGAIIEVKEGMSMTEEEVKNLLIKTNAIMNGHFLLTSGLHSPHYVEKFNVLQHPKYFA